MANKDEELRELREKLRDAETKQATIAELAKKILEGDKAKDQNLAALRETVHQQTNDIARLQAQIKARDELLTDAENDIATLKKQVEEINEKKSAHNAELQQKVSELRCEMSDKETKISELEEDNRQLKKSLSSKQRELGARESRSVLSASISAENAMKADICELNKVVANMKSEQISLVDEITRLEERVLQLTRDLENETNRTAEVSQICENYKRDLQESRQQYHDLAAELKEYRTSEKPARKGNSMFFEFVDERIKLEKDLLKLKSQNDFLAAQKKNYEHEIDSLRQELILALALWTEDSAKGDTSALQAEVSRLRTEVASLNEKLLSKKKTVDVLEVSSKGKPQNFQECVIASLRTELKAVTEKYKEASLERMQYFDKLGECEAKYASEVRQRCKLQNTVNLLETRLAKEKAKRRKIAITGTAKLSKDKLAEKIADINDLSTSDPTISEVMSSFTEAAGVTAARLHDTVSTAAAVSEAEDSEHTKTEATLKNDSAFKLKEKQEDLKKVNATPPMKRLKKLQEAEGSPLLDFFSPPASNCAETTEASTTETEHPGVLLKKKVKRKAFVAKDQPECKQQ